MLRWFAVLSVLLAGLTALAVADATRVLPLRYAEAPLLAAYLGGLSAGQRTPETARRDLATRLVQADGRRVAQGDLVAAYATQAESYPQAAPGTRLPLPVGLSQPPVALPRENALLARGTAEALDALGELLVLLDRPTPMIRIEVRLVGDTGSGTDRRGDSLEAANGGTSFQTAGPGAGVGEMLRWSLQPLDGLYGRSRNADRQRGVTAATVTTLSGVPAALQVGQLLPVFLTTVGQDAFGGRQVTTRTELLFTGFELYVLPRLSGRDEVTMWLRPTVSEWTGTVTSPHGDQLPLTETLLVETQVRIRSGDTLAIGGLDRVSETRASAMGGALSEDDRQAREQAVMLVTPNIIWPLDDGAD